MATKPFDSLTRTTTRRDPEDDIRRTAVVIGEENSIDLVSPSGVFLARVNIYRDDAQSETSIETLMVDVVDSANRYRDHRAVTFKGGQRTAVEAGNVVAAHFEGRP